MILVTGASGNVGASVAASLRERGARLRVATRHPAGKADAADEVVLDFLDPSTWGAACRGCEGVFLLRPPAIADTRATLVPFVEAARCEGVRQVAFVSVAGAGSSPLVPHHAVEEHLRHGPPGWTILRPGFFAQNLGGPYRKDIVEQGRIFVPAAAGKAAFVDARDVGEAAAEVLLSPAEHEGRTYTLTGSRALSFAQAAAILSRELRRRVRYQAASVPAYVLHGLRRGMPPGQVAVLTILHLGLRFGQAEEVDPALGRLLGRAPRTLRDYVHDHRDLWM